MSRLKMLITITYIVIIVSSCRGQGTESISVQEPTEDTFISESLRPSEGVQSELKESVPETEEYNIFSIEEYADKVLVLVNIERIKAGLPGLTTTSELKDAANLRAREIESLFDHKRPDGSSFSTSLDECGVSYKAAGENIAYGHLSPREVVSAWMDSEGHRVNILDDNFGKMGVGIHLDEDGSIGWVQLFID